jgi:hypothetical protein
MQNFGIIALATNAFVVQKVEFRPAFDFAVVAVDKRPGVCVFLGHLVLFEHGVDAFEVFGHIRKGFEARWALIVGLCVFLVAFVVDAVAAGLKKLSLSLCPREKLTIKITVVVDVNIYSPQMGQSLSKLRSIHLWRPLRLMAMQMLHVLQWK